MLSRPVRSLPTNFRIFLVKEKGPTRHMTLSRDQFRGDEMLRGESVVPNPARIGKASLVPALMVYDFRQDDPKKCTAARLRKSRLVRSLPNMRRIPPAAIVLNPKSSKTLSLEDRELIQWNGVVALDCSWNLSDRVFDRNLPGNNRRLPVLLAGNPTNYGIPGRLSTAEALAAALILTGFRKLAEEILSLFKWGETFLSLNQDPLESYAAAESSEISFLEEEFFGSRRG